LGVDLNYFSEKFKSVAIESDSYRIASNESLVKQSTELPSGKHKLSWNMSRRNWVGADFSGITLFTPKGVNE
jgi:hypothetical protein